MRFRLSILGFMGAIAVIAIGMAAIRSNDETWAGIILALTVSALCTATLWVGSSPAAASPDAMNVGDGRQSRGWWLVAMVNYS